MTPFPAGRAADLRPYVGWLGQVARADAFTVDDGPGRGSRMVRLVNGGGLEIEVHPDRGLDIGRVTVGGVPLAWMSPTDITAPHLYDPHGKGWLRTFGGGLLTTCGLDTFGPASQDAGQELGLHGRVSATPARVRLMESNEDGVCVEGVVRQTGVFAENLRMRRRIRSDFGSSVFVVEDEVTNDGFEPAPHMILYHVNLGWPLLGEDSVVEFPEAQVAPRDADAEKGLAEHAALGPPQAGYREQVFRHTLACARAVVRLVNPAIPLSFRLEFDTGTLPVMYQWKMLGQGHYVLGIEPANSPNLFGRAAARAAGELPVLEPGSSVSYKLEFHAELST